MTDRNRLMSDLMMPEGAQPDGYDDRMRMANALMGDLMSPNAGGKRAMLNALIPTDAGPNKTFYGVDLPSAVVDRLEAKESRTANLAGFLLGSTRYGLASILGAWGALKFPDWSAREAALMRDRTPASQSYNEGDDVAMDLNGPAAAVGHYPASQKGDFLHYLRPNAGAGVLPEGVSDWIYRNQGVILHNGIAGLHSKPTSYAGGTADVPNLLYSAGSSLLGRNRPYRPDIPAEVLSYPPNQTELGEWK